MFSKLFARNANQGRTYFQARRGILSGGAVALLASRIAGSSAVFGIGALRSRSALAIEPTTVIAIAGAAVSAISSLRSATSRGNGIDPATKAYMEQLLQNQETIIKSLRDLSSQIVTLADLVEIVPATTISLDEDVEAGAVLNDMLLAYREASTARNFGNEDLQAFQDARDRMRRTASRHRSIADRLGHSYDLVASVDTLTTAMSALVAIARISNYTSNGHKRQLRIVAGSLRQTIDALSQKPADPNAVSLSDIERTHSSAKTKNIEALSAVLARWGKPPIGMSESKKWLTAPGNEKLSWLLETGRTSGIGFEDVPRGRSGAPTQDFTIYHKGTVSLLRAPLPGFTNSPEHFSVSYELPPQHGSASKKVNLPEIVNTAIQNFNAAAASYHLHAETLALLTDAADHLDGVFDAIDRLGTE